MFIIIFDFAVENFIENTINNVKISLKQVNIRLFVINCQNKDIKITVDLKVNNMEIVVLFLIKDNEDLLEKMDIINRQIEEI